jgi:hypothetical protein
MTRRSWVAPAIVRTCVAALPFYSDGRRQLVLAPPVAFNGCDDPAHFMLTVNQSVRSQPKSLIQRTFLPRRLNRSAFGSDRASEPRSLARPTPALKGETHD